MYQQARRNRLDARWEYLDYSHPDVSVATDKQSLTAQARNMQNNDPVMDGVLSYYVARIVGSNMKVEPMIKNSKGELYISLNKEIKEYYECWFKNPYLNGTPGSVGQRWECSTLFRDGEYFGWFKIGHEFEHLTEVPISIQLLESDSVPNYLNNEETNLIQGIQLNKFGRPVFYHVLKNLREYHSMDTIKVPRREIYHAKLTKRMGQTRGITAFHNTLGIFQDANEVKKFEMAAAKVAATISYQILKDKDADIPPEQIVQPGDRKFEARPMSVFDELNPGEVVEVINPNGRPNVQLETFNRSLYQAAGRSLGIGLGAMLGVFNGSYSAERQSNILDKMHLATRTNDFASQTVEVQYDAFLKTLVLYNLIKLPNDVLPRSLFHKEVTSPTMESIDRLKDVNADVAEMNAGIRSKSDIQRGRGYNPAVVNAEIKADATNRNEKEEAEKEE